MIFKNYSRMKGYSFTGIWKSNPPMWFLFAFFFCYSSYGQETTASVSLDSNEILIGRQIKLHLQLITRKSGVYQWPSIPDSISKIEVLEKSGIDTLISTRSDSMILKQNITITCFDSGYYAIPPFRFVDKNNPDTLRNFVETQPLLLSVFTMAVDTTKAFRDIKEPVYIPFSWQDAWPYVAALLGLLIAALAIYYFRKKFGSKKTEPTLKIPKRPAHELALEELRKLESEKLWQQGLFKEFQTRLSDIVRTYIEYRWSVPAMEMTTDEILNYPVIYKLSDDQVEKLRYLLTISDLVKFAKMIPMPQENERCLKNSYDFILNSKETIHVSEDNAQEVPV